METDLTTVRPSRSTPKVPDNEVVIFLLTPASERKRLASLRHCR
jgi:hypothetical protein